MSSDSPEFGRALYNILNGPSQDEVIADAAQTLELLRTREGGEMLAPTVRMLGVMAEYAHDSVLQPFISKLLTAAEAGMREMLTPDAGTENRETASP